MYATEEKLHKENTKFSKDNITMQKKISEDEIALTKLKEDI